MRKEFLRCRRERKKEGEAEVLTECDTGPTDMRKKITTRDVIILGGGPAGMSAALWSAELGLTATLLERRGELGGQLLWTHNPIDNYLGIHARNGRELRQRFLAHFRSSGILGTTDAEVSRADLPGRTVLLTDGRTFTGRAIIIATGVRRRQLNIPGELEFRDRGIIESGALSRREVSGGHVVVIGGGDAALENALILSETARKVTLLHRRSELTARDEFRSAARVRENIEFRPHAHAIGVNGRSTVEAVEIADSLTGERGTIRADFLLIRIGVVPNTELFAGQIELDDRAYIVTDRTRTTTMDRVFAIGDVASPHSPTISGAVGGGASAVKEIHRRLTKYSPA